MSESLKNKTLLASGFLGFIVPTYFAWILYVNQVPQSVATWGMVFVLDVLGLILAYKGGNKKPYLQLGWAIAAACIFVAVLLNKNPVAWRWVESVSVTLCAIAILLWLTRGPLAALWAYMAAMYISFVPTIAEYWSAPEISTTWLWEWTIVSCVLAILGAKKQDFANTFVPWAAIGLNAIILYLCYR